MDFKTIDLKGLATSDAYSERCEATLDRYTQQFGQSSDPVFISAPGRVEIGGNHTDHQNGCVLAAAINLDVLGVAAINGTSEIHLLSEGYPINYVDANDLSMHEEEQGKTTALIRGVADGCKRRGYNVGGFNAYLSSEVLIGSGLSSSAAFEVWVGTAINHLFNDGRISPIEVAQIGQYAENKHFGKPCGLEDQMAIAVGGIVGIDFADNENPQVTKIESSIPGYTLCVIDSGADHADLTGEYAAIRSEMELIAGFFGKNTLREVDKNRFMKNISQLRAAFGDRPVLRAMHFFADNERAVQERDAVKAGDIKRFLSLVNASGRSSFMYLQNVYVPGAVDHQALPVCLAMCDELMDGDGAFRIQGGGFAGTVEAFVPDHMLERFISKMEEVLIRGSCHVLSIRPLGAVRLDVRF